MSFDKSLCGRSGFLDGQSFRVFCAAKFFYRAYVAFGFIRQANERAQIDKRGIETRCIVFRDKLRGIFPEFFAPDCRINWYADVEQAGEQTRAIRFDNWNRLVESKRRDCVRRIAASAGQVTNRRDVARQNPAVPVPHNPGGGMKIPDTIVIAESLPGMKDVILRSPCE